MIWLVGLGSVYLAIGLFFGIASVIGLKRPADIIGGLLLVTLLWPIFVIWADQGRDKRRDTGKPVEVPAAKTGDKGEVKVRRAAAGN